MKEDQSIYQNLKLWLSKQIKVEQPQTKQLHFENQQIHLDPIFDSHKQKFMGVICNQLHQTNEKNYLLDFKNALDDISYWHCHGRAILSLLPLPVTFLNQAEFLAMYENSIIASQLPVGQIRVPLIAYKNQDIKSFEAPLKKLQRLGLIFELKNFSGNQTELSWLNSQMFQGIHISTGFLRAAMTTTLSRELFNDLLITCQSQNHHTYGEGISLVHDFNFAKDNHIQYCYGPLMMPSVSKHQLLKITSSQLSSSLNSTPIKHNQYGD